LGVDVGVGVGVGFGLVKIRVGGELDAAGDDAALVDAEFDPEPDVDELADVRGWLVREAAAGRGSRLPSPRQCSAQVTPRAATTTRASDPTRSRSRAGWFDRRCDPVGRSGSLSVIEPRLLHDHRSLCLDAQPAR
jgi:hypothetical protein